MKTWSCKIGEVAADKLPSGADALMRKAVQAAYLELTGQEPDFCFSGWGAKLDEVEREIVENDINTVGVRIVEEARNEGIDYNHNCQTLEN